MGLYYAIYWLQQMYQRAWSSLSLLLSEAPISITTSSQHIRWINVRYILLFSFKIQKKISGSSKLYECNGVQPPPLNSHNKYYHVFILKLFIIIIYKNTIISMYDYVLVLRRTFLFLKYQICFNGIKMILQNSFELNTISVVPCFYNGT